MGQVSRGANREIGWQVARRDGWFVILLDILVWTSRFLFRFVSGRPLRGDRYRKTDATFLRAGTQQLYRKDRPPTRWSYLPEWKRAAIRIAIPAVISLVLWLYFYHCWALYTLAAVAALIVLRRLWRWWRVRSFRRVYLNPLAKAVAPVLDIPSHVKTHRWLSVSPELPGLLPDVVKPMGAWELRVRQWYGQWVEPAVRYVPDRAMRAYWWVTGQYSPVAKAWRGQR